MQPVFSAILSALAIVAVVFSVLSLLVNQSAEQSVAFSLLAFIFGKAAGWCYEKMD